MVAPAIDPVLPGARPPTGALDALVFLDGSEGGLLAATVSSGCGAGVVPATEAAIGAVVGRFVAFTRFGC